MSSGSKHTLVNYAQTPNGQASMLAGLGTGFLVSAIKGDATRVVPFTVRTAAGCWLSLTMPPLILGRPSSGGLYIVWFGLLGAAEHLAEVTFEDYKA